MSRQVLLSHLRINAAQYDGFNLRIITKAFHIFTCGSSVPKKSDGFFSCDGIQQLSILEMFKALSNDLFGKSIAAISLRLQLAIALS